MIETVGINGKTVVVKGIGKMYYQEGVPIGMIVKRFEAKGYIVSVLNIADELLKNGWQPERVIKSLSHEFLDSAVPIDIPLLETFCHSDYDQQREMLFQFLFNSDRGIAREFFNDLLDIYVGSQR